MPRIEISNEASVWLDSPLRYGLVTRLFHWGMAYLMIWQFLSILTWRFFGPAEWVTTFTSLGPYHGTVGLFTIVLVILRAAWAYINRKRRPVRERGFVGRLAVFGHLSLYALMFAIPALAILRSYGSGKGWHQWGVQIVPQTGIETGWMMAPADALHGLLAWALSILIAGHVIMALVHQFRWRDGTLLRMLGTFRAR